MLLLPARSPAGWLPGGGSDTDAVCVSGNLTSLVGPTCFLPSFPPSPRMVVRCLWPLQSQRHLLSCSSPCAQAERHPLALLPGPQLLAACHPHDGAAHRHLRRVWAVGGTPEKSPPRLPGPAAPEHRTRSSDSALLAPGVQKSQLSPP